jgi:hypothetical protein
LRQVDPETGEATDKKFVFNVKDGDQDFNQKRYEDIGDVITECIYEYLQQEPLNLKVEKTPGQEALQSIFHSSCSTENLSQRRLICIWFQRFGL